MEVVVSVVLGLSISVWTRRLGFVVVYQVLQRAGTSRPVWHDEALDGGSVAPTAGHEAASRLARGSARRFLNSRSMHWG